LGAGLARIDGPAERRGRRDDAARDEVGEVGGEPGELEPDPVLPQVLVEARIPGLAPLGHEVGVAEIWKEEVVEGGRAEARPGASPEPRAGLLDHEGDRSMPCRRLAEHAVVLDPESTGDEQPVEKAELLLAEDPGHVARGAEHALVVALFVAVAEADRARAPLPDQGGGEPLGLAALR